jgi:hypothetical protein
MPTFKEAAIIVLQEIGKPLAITDITKISLKEGLINTSGKTPRATMWTEVYRDIKKNKTNSAFIKCGKGLFYLNPLKQITPSKKYER